MFWVFLTPQNGTIWFNILSTGNVKYEGYSALILFQTMSEKMVSFFFLIYSFCTHYTHPINQVYHINSIHPICPCNTRHSPTRLTWFTPQISLFIIVYSRWKVAVGCIDWLPGGVGPVEQLILSWSEGGPHPSNRFPPYHLTSPPCPNLLAKGLNDTKGLNEAMIVHIWRTCWIHEFCKCIGTSMSWFWGLPGEAIVSFSAVSFVPNFRGASHGGATLGAGLGTTDAWVYIS